ncbi:MAG: hypothetical protein AUI60_00215 [Thaumarchaeota archaeon 13_1_40CM_2_39_4]|nr:MAG: hypothetical protein AUI60_00215 [Thaumarchaeota archaeon 13_1_40CM_2_39_4]
MKSWIPIADSILIIAGLIFLIISSHYNFFTCPPLPQGESCDNSAGIATFTVGIIMLLLGIGLFIVAIQKAKFQLKRNS